MQGRASGGEEVARLAVEVHRHHVVGGHRKEIEIADQTARVVVHDLVAFGKDQAVDTPPIGIGILRFFEDFHQGFLAFTDHNEVDVGMRSISLREV